jgi:6-pyruvoyl-tetrahydropterin synthase
MMVRDFKKVQVISKEIIDMLSARSLMKIIKLLVLSMLIVSCVIISSSTTLLSASYYIDFQNGNDINSGGR